MYRLHFQKPSDENNSTEETRGSNISQPIPTQSNENTGPEGHRFNVNNNTVGTVQNNIRGVTQKGIHADINICNKAVESVKNEIREVDQQATSTNFNVNNNATGSVQNEMHDIDQQGTSSNFNVNNDGRGNITNTMSGIYQKPEDDAEPSIR